MFEDPQVFDFEKITMQPFMCLDGRAKTENMYTPGGDAGEFILALIVYEDLTDQTLSQEKVEEYLNAYLECMTPNSFIMCQDEHAVDHLEKELDVEGLDLHNPHSDQHESIIDSLKSHENQGDQHLSLLLQHPDLYSIEPTIVKHFIEAFYNILWDHSNPNHDRLTLRILEGHHKENAFLEIKTASATDNTNH